MIARGESCDDSLAPRNQVGERTPIMTHSRRTISVVSGALALVLLAGCGGYYQVTDPNAARLYYTRSLNIERGSADLVMKDELRSTEVRLAEYEIKKLTRDEYLRATRPLLR